MPNGMESDNLFAAKNLSRKSVVLGWKASSE